MNKIIIGIIIGAGLTLLAQYGWKYYQSHEFKDHLQLYELAKFDLEHKLEGARVLDISVGPDSKASVSYVYDKLFDVYFNYERDGKIKKITAQYGIAKGTWIAPKNTTFEVLDDRAEIVHDKSKKMK